MISNSDSVLRQLLAFDLDSGQVDFHTRPLVLIVKVAKYSDRDGQ